MDKAIYIYALETYIGTKNIGVCEGKIVAVEKHAECMKNCALNSHNLI